MSKMSSFEPSNYTVVTKTKPQTSISTHTAFCTIIRVELHHLSIEASRGLSPHTGLNQIGHFVTPAVECGWVIGKICHRIHHFIWHGKKFSCTTTPSIAFAYMAIQFSLQNHRVGIIFQSVTEILEAYRRKRCTVRASACQSSVTVPGLMTARVPIGEWTGLNASVAVPLGNLIIEKTVWPHSNRLRSHQKTPFDGRALYEEVCPW